MGKIVASCFSVFAISFFALPAVSFIDFRPLKFVFHVLAFITPRIKITGNSGIRFCAKSATKATTKALQSADTSSGSSHSVLMAMLCRR
jgi:hypothetical protein